MRTLRLTAPRGLHHTTGQWRRQDSNSVRFQHSHTSHHKPTCTRVSPDTQVTLKQRSPPGPGLSGFYLLSVSLQLSLKLHEVRGAHPRSENSARVPPDSPVGPSHPGIQPRRTENYFRVPNRRFPDAGRKCSFPFLVGQMCGCKTADTRADCIYRKKMRKWTHAVHTVFFKGQLYLQICFKHVHMTS